jgi:NAD+ synthase
MSTTPRPIDSAADTLAIDAAFVIELLRSFIADGVRKVGFERVIVGLSGGVDSSVVTALAVSALGAGNVVAAFMPYRSSDPQSQIDALAVCDKLAISARIVDITPEVDAYFERFPDADRTRRGNKMARERMSILYDLSMAERALVLGTSNKTELLLGYGTLFGDMASALNPIGDLYKTQLYEVARALDLPQSVLTKPPSADLWVGQSDEDELGMWYAIVDQVL